MAYLNQNPEEEFDHGIGQQGHSSSATWARDPEVRYTPKRRFDRQSVTIATTDTWKDKATGEKKEATEWHRVVLLRQAWPRSAGQYLKKGSADVRRGRPAHPQMAPTRKARSATPRKSSRQ
jgi:hypothetical protein